MKKIKNSRQLLIEQKKLLKMQEDLEKQIVRDWQSIKHHLRPGQLLRETIGSFLYTDMFNKGINCRAANRISYGANFLVSRLIKKATAKIAQFL